MPHNSCSPNPASFRDHVPPPPDQSAQIEKALGRQRDSPVPKDTHCMYFFPVDLIRDLLTR